MTLLARQKNKLIIQSCKDHTTRHFTTQSKYTDVKLIGTSRANVSTDRRLKGLSWSFQMSLKISFAKSAAAAAAAASLQSCPTLCDPIDGSPRGSPTLHKKKKKEERKEGIDRAKKDSLWVFFGNMRG